MPPQDPPIGFPRPRHARRLLITHRLAGTADLALGVAAAHLLFPTQWSTSASPLVEQGAWVAVASVAAVPPGTAIRFTTTSVIGWLLHQSDGTFLALAA